MTLGFTPTLLLVEDQEWTARSIESILRPHGFVVLKAYTGNQCLQVIPRVAPDVILAAATLPDMNGVELLRQLRDRGALRPSMPIVLISIEEMSQADRLQAFESGVWDIIRPPFAPQELALKMTNWIAAKRDADGAREEGLVDSRTGVYNFKGLVRRTEEIVAEANRSEQAVSFIVVGPSFRNGSSDSAEAAAAHAASIEALLATALQSACRVSDAVGRLGEEEFAIVAPQTDQPGAAILAQRILESIPADKSGVRLRAGVYSAHRSKKDPVVSVDLLSRATAALRKAQLGDEGANIQAYTATN